MQDMDLKCRTLQDMQDIVDTMFLQLECEKGIGVFVWVGEDWVGVPG